MDRARYEQYASAFNSRDYDTVYDFYADGAKLSFFGVDLPDRQSFKAFYQFLHAHLIETLGITRFASSDELVALEGIIRIEATEDLRAQDLEARGYPAHFAIAKGDVREMPQYIHYHVDQAGKFTWVGCALI